MIPKERGDQKVVLEQFKCFSPQGIIICSFLHLDGDIGKHLQVKDSDAWKILRRAENYSLMMMDSLDAKLMDEDINKVLERMFPGESHKDAYQKIGRKHKISNNWVKIKQIKNDGKTM
jgi:hypothetical protein